MQSEQDDESMWPPPEEEPAEDGTITPTNFSGAQNFDASFSSATWDPGSAPLYPPPQTSGVPPSALWNPCVTLERSEIPNLDGFFDILSLSTGSSSPVTALQPSYHSGSDTPWIPLGMTLGDPINSSHQVGTTANDIYGLSQTSTFTSPLQQSFNSDLGPYYPLTYSASVPLQELRPNGLRPHQAQAGSQSYLQPGFLQPSRNSIIPGSGHSRSATYREPDRRTDVIISQSAVIVQRSGHKSFGTRFHLLNDSTSYLRINSCYEPGEGLWKRKITCVCPSGETSHRWRMTESGSQRSKVHKEVILAEQVKSHPNSAATFNKSARGRQAFDRNMKSLLQRHVDDMNSASGVGVGTGCNSSFAWKQGGKWHRDQPMTPGFYISSEQTVSEYRAPSVYENV